MIAIIDYGMGNLRSVQKALEQVGASAVITNQSRQIDQAQKIVLPGVGAMDPAMKRLTSLGIIPSMKNAVDQKKPFLGICLGLQLLFEKSDEGGTVEGLGMLPGVVMRFTRLKVPHMGWNQLSYQNQPCRLFNDIDQNSNVYFCHSYYVKPKDPSIIATTTDYGISFTSAVFSDNIFGVQFHPEKSQKIGLKILKNFAQLS